MSLPMLSWTREDDAAIAALGSAMIADLNGGIKPVELLASGQCQPRRDIEQALTAQAVEMMMRLGMIQGEGDQLIPLFQAQMIGPHLVYSDLRRSMRAVRRTKDRDLYVDPMWEGPAIANLLVREEAANGLDMGCGCGIIALAMSSYCRQVTALDVNPRALMLTRFNVALNGIRNVDAVESNLFSAVPGASYDRIVFNAPVGMELMPRNALESGEQILFRFFRELNTHLRPHGVVQMNLCVKDWSKATFFDNLEEWLSPMANEYQALFLELWCVDRGVKFEVRKWLAPFVVPHAHGRLRRIRRGLLFLRRDGTQRRVQFATKYDQWARVLGAEFGDGLVRWAMSASSEIRPPGPEADFVAHLEAANRPLGLSVARGFYEQLLGNVPSAEARGSEISGRVEPGGRSIPSFSNARSRLNED